MLVQVATATLHPQLLAVRWRKVKAQQTAIPNQSIALLIGNCIDLAGKMHRLFRLAKQRHPHAV